MCNWSKAPRHRNVPTLIEIAYKTSYQGTSKCVITFTTRIESEVNPHSSATLSFNGEWQAASLKSVPSNKLFDSTAAMCFVNEHNFPPTCWKPRNHKTHDHRRWKMKIHTSVMRKWQKKFQFCDQLWKPISSIWKHENILRFSFVFRLCILGKQKESGMKERFTVTLTPRGESRTRPRRASELQLEW